MVSNTFGVPAWGNALTGRRSCLAAPLIKEHKVPEQPWPSVFWAHC